LVLRDYFFLVDLGFFQMCHVLGIIIARLMVPDKMRQLQLSILLFVSVQPIQSPQAITNGVESSIDSGFWNIGISFRCARDLLLIKIYLYY
jgi:hypothetical protein